MLAKGGREKNKGVFTVGRRVGWEEKRKLPVKKILTPGLNLSSMNHHLLPTTTDKVPLHREARTLLLIWEVDFCLCSFTSPFKKWNNQTYF